MLEKWILNKSPNLKKIVSVIYQNHFINKAKAIHVLTEKEFEDVKLAGHYHNSIFKIPNFVEIYNNFNFSSLPKWWTPEMNNKRIYLYFGRIHEKKGWRELCDAWSIICSNDNFFKNSSFLLFAGWIDDCNDFIQTCSKLSYKFNNTQFIGAKYARERAEVFAFADIFILPSKSEGLPMVVLEAWSSRLFAILTRDCNLPDGFEYGAALETGQSSAEIINSLKAVSEFSHHQLQSSKEAAYQLVASKFSKSAVIGQFFTLYQRLLHKEFNNAHTA
jgi:glycosyltransferase involved in cell wall biosynthesis